MFDILGSKDLLAMLEADYTDFKAHPDSSRLAIHCIITSYHLSDWVWSDWLKRDLEKQRQLGITTVHEFKDWISSKWSGFASVREIANATKHLGKPAQPTQVVSGYGEGPYGTGPYGSSYLLIDQGEDHPGRWQTAEQLIDESLTFWRGFFDEHYPHTM